LPRPRVRDTHGRGGDDRQTHGTFDMTQTSFPTTGRFPLDEALVWRASVWNAWLPLALLLLLPLWAYADFSSYQTLLQNEIYGLLELTHAAFPLIAFFICAMLLRENVVRSSGLRTAFVAVFAMGAFWMAGEEVSWGQHHFGWATSPEWAAVNNQQETNLHNTSMLLNHLPRAVLTIAIALGGLVMPFVARSYPGLVQDWFTYLYPPASLAPLALIILALEGLVQLGNAVDLTSLIRFHDGELQELFIVWAVLLYAIELRRRALLTRA
ncbi:hypothetical protein N9H93_04920, partial [Rhizobiaceae bacterium]|nr:hypothetical protein [Rhizobiaceae bacterium]